MHNISQRLCGLMVKTPPSIYVSMTFVDEQAGGHVGSNPTMGILHIRVTFEMLSVLLIKG